jgi:predicted flap endonuclease-1-like 5' DNA nuclease
MKRAYWFLLALAIWCTSCAIWYMFVVKGIPSDPEYFHPQPPLIAIGEILLMLLIACLIGYGIGWSLRDTTVELLEDELIQRESERSDALKVQQEKEEQLNLARQQLGQLTHQSSERNAQSKRDMDLLHDQIEQLRSDLALARVPVVNTGTEVLENEANTLRYRIRQLEFQNGELEENAVKLRDQLEAASQSRPGRIVESVHPFVRPVLDGEKDDLTQIKGIGPFIEKRLNMIGIYTLSQISEFTPEVMEQVAKAIEFFPQRMLRDNWVDQAKKLI